MGEEYRAKVFKSGNSMALRLPKALGFVDGDELDLIPRTDGSVELRRRSVGRVTLDELYGSVPGFMADGRGDIEQVERDWSSASQDAA